MFKNGNYRKNFKLVFLITIIVAMMSAGVYADDIALGPQIVIPSGKPIGVKIESEGVLVVGLSYVIDKQGEKRTPCADAGIEIGDIILAIEGTVIEKEIDVIALLENATSNSVKIKLKRKDAILEKEVVLVKDKEENTNKIGLWVRNNVAGIGTMTFIDPKTENFAALGHGIADAETNNMVDLKEGVILRAKVENVKKAETNAPGELIGQFYEENPVGDITMNTQFGLYGRLINKEIFDGKPIPVASFAEIKEGPATILSTINGFDAKPYKVNIIKINKQTKPDTKSFMIEIVDKELLKITGGIVQGMSGSPIIQNEKLVGAVTHVLINNPKRGYGIAAQWMCEEIVKVK